GRDRHQGRDEAVGRRGECALRQAPAGMAITVLDRLRPGQRGQIHWRAVMQDVDEEIWRRRLQLRAFQGPADWQRHIDETRRRFLTAIGPLPERTSLPVVTAGVLQRDGYVIEKLLVETQPGFFAPAHLYLPARLNGQAPG